MFRRDFLPALLAGAGSLARAASNFDRSRLSIFTDEIGTLDAAIAFARQYRLQYVELRAYRPRPDREWRETRQRLDDAGLKVSFFNSALLKYTLPGTTAVKWEDFYENLYRAEGMTPEKLFARRDEDLDGALRAAEILGAPAIRTFAFWRVAEPGALTARLADLLGPMAERASRAKVALALENEFATNCGTTAETMAVLDRVPGLRLNWDPQNSVALGEKVYPDGLARIPVGRLANVQIKAEGLIGFGGAPKLDWAGIFTRLAAGGYRGCFGLETHTLKGPEVNIPASHDCLKAMLRLVGEAS